VSFPGPQERFGRSRAQLMLRVVAHPSYHSKAMASPGRQTPATSIRLSGADLDISGKGGQVGSLASYCCCAILGISRSSFPQTHRVAFSLSCWTMLMSFSQFFSTTTATGFVAVWPSR